MFDYTDHGRNGGFFLAILCIVGLWQIFTKAGREGWKAIIPFYNFYVLLKVVGKPWWWLLLMFVPVANLVIFIWTMNMLSKSFGQGILFTIGLVLLNPIFLLLLGFGGFAYRGPAGEEARRSEPEEIV